MSNQPSISAAIGNQNLSQSDTREATIEPSILMEIADRERLFAVDPDGETEIGDMICC